jgi:hypothetical protein
MGRYLFLTTFIVAIILLTIDGTISQVSDTLEKETPSFLGISLFVAVSIMFIVTSFVLIRLIKSSMSTFVNSSMRMIIVNRTMLVTQLALIGILVALVMQIIFLSQYYTLSLILATALTTISATVVTVISALILFEWYRYNRSSYVVLIFAVTFALLAYTIIYLGIDDIHNLILKNQIITPKSEVTYASDTYVGTGNIQDILRNIYEFVGTLTFILFIAGSAIMLRHYSAKLGLIKFWILTILPLVYFSTTLVDTFELYVPKSDTEKFNYYVYTSLSNTVGGLLLGFLFWVISRAMRPNKSVANYLIFCAYGFILQSVASGGGVAAASYPPFGYATVSMSVLSLYMIILGLYSTAISISQDIRLRKHIKNLTLSDSGFLSTIGEAQMEKSVQSKASELENVVKEQRKELEKKTGIESSIQEQDIKGYLLEVLQEVDKYKSNK